MFVLILLYWFICINTFIFVVYLYDYSFFVVTLAWKGELQFGYGLKEYITILSGIYFDNDINDDNSGNLMHPPREKKSCFFR